MSASLPPLLRNLAQRRLELLLADAASKPKPIDPALLEKNDWFKHARPDQLPPKGDWFVWMLSSGRGAGKTRAGAEWCIQQAREMPGSHGCLLGATLGDAQSIQAEGSGAGSSIIECNKPDFEAKWKPGKGGGGMVVWPNGSKASAFSAHNFESLRGPQFHWAWVDELAKFRWARQAWNMLMLGLRLPPRARACVTTTPRPIKLMREILDSKTTVVSRGSTMDNIANLSENFKAQVLAQYEGTRLGRQEIYGDMLEDIEGALWTHDMLDSDRAPEPKPNELRRVVVSVDPSGGSGEGNDEQGITCQALTQDGKGLLLADATCKESPAEWGRRAVILARDNDADCIVAENNFGGAMVEHVIKTAAEKDGVHIRVVLVTASRGKVQRAEPVAALYEQKKISHCGSFPKLEDELCAFTPAGYIGEGSPNRADALIWGFTELMLGSAAPTYSGLTKSSGAWGRSR